MKGFDQSLHIDPTFAPAYIGRGDSCRCYLEDYKGAIEDYTQALRISPNSSEAYVGRGITLYKLGDCSSAVEDCTKAILLEANHAEALLQPGSWSCRFRRLPRGNRGFAEGGKLLPRTRLHG